MIEHVLNQRYNAILDQSQSDLQKGLTAGHASIEAALILSECITERLRTPRRLYFDGINGADWLLLRNLYSDLTTVVKWEGTFSSPSVINQGVRQARGGGGGPPGGPVNSPLQEVQPSSPQPAGR